MCGSSLRLTRSEDHESKFLKVRRRLAPRNADIGWAITAQYTDYCGSIYIPRVLPSPHQPEKRRRRDVLSTTEYCDVVDVVTLKMVSCLRQSQLLQEDEL